MLTRTRHALNFVVTLSFASLCAIGAVVLEGHVERLEAEQAAREGIRPAVYLDGDRDRLSALIEQLTGPVPVEPPVEPMPTPKTIQGEKLAQVVVRPCQPCPGLQGPHCC